MDLALINQGNAATFGARSGLQDLVPFKVSRFRQLGLTQQPYVDSHSRDGLLQLLLLPPSINTPHIQATDVKSCPCIEMLAISELWLKQLPLISGRAACMY